MDNLMSLDDLYQEENDNHGKTKKSEKPAEKSPKKELIPEQKTENITKTDSNEGLRFNSGKIDLTMLSPIAQYCESLVCMFGAVKYSRDNYKHFKKDTEEQTGEERAKLEFLQSLQRHLWLMTRGEECDKESKQHHAAHIIWNAARLLDLHYLGNTHMVDGKDLFQQPLKRPLPEVPTLENFESIYGIKPKSKK